MRDSRSDSIVPDEKLIVACGTIRNSIATNKSHVTWRITKESGSGNFNASITSIHHDFRHSRVWILRRACNAVQERRVIERSHKAVKIRLVRTRDSGVEPEGYRVSVNRSETPRRHESVRGHGYRWSHRAFYSWESNNDRREHHAVTQTDLFDVDPLYIIRDRPKVAGVTRAETCLRRLTRIRNRYRQPKINHRPEAAIASQHPDAISPAATFGLYLYSINSDGQYYCVVWVWITRLTDRKWTTVVEH